MHHSCPALVRAATKMAAHHDGDAASDSDVEPDRRGGAHGVVAVPIAAFFADSAVLQEILRITPCGDGSRP